MHHSHVQMFRSELPPSTTKEMPFGYTSDASSRQISQIIGSPVLAWYVTAAPMHETQDQSDQVIHFVEQDRDSAWPLPNKSDTFVASLFLHCRAHETAQHGPRHIRFSHRSTHRHHYLDSSSLISENGTRLVFTSSMILRRSSIGVLPLGNATLPNLTRPSVTSSQNGQTMMLTLFQAGCHPARGRTYISHSSSSRPVSCWQI